MNVATAVSLLLAHFPPEERTVPDTATYPGRNAAVLAALNGAMQEYYGTGTSWKRRAPRGALLHAPANITLTVTNGSRSVNFSDAWQEWFAGCTIAVAGGSTDNQILKNTELLYPHDGPGGTVSATVLHDSVTLDRDVQSVLASVRIVDGPPLHPVASPEQLTLSRPRERDYGHQNYVPSFPAPLRKSQSTGTPLFYFVDSYQEDEFASPVWRMLISPAPATSMLVSYRARLSPPRFTSASSTAKIPVPYDAVEAIILPIAAQRLSASPFFNQGPNTAEIARQAQLARQELFRMTAQAKPGMRMRPGF